MTGGAGRLGDRETHLGPGSPATLSRPRSHWLPGEEFQQSKGDPTLHLSQQESQAGPGTDGPHLPDLLECPARTVCVRSQQASLRYLSSPRTREQNPNS